jgi:geranylgeranyl diphosphate synthase type II
MNSRPTGKSVLNLEAALDRYLPPAGREPKTLHKAMRYSVFSGGKRIRPAILLEAAKACGGKSKDAMPFACAVEFTHTYSLIHDDLPAMDDDDYRRGKPTCHKVFGEALAILAGDGLLTLAFQIIAQYPAPFIAVKAAEELAMAAGTLGMVGGQALDLRSSPGKKKGKFLTKLRRLKTGKLFEVSAKLGAISARANFKETAAISRYGESLGLAFQIADDISDGAYSSARGSAASLKRARQDVLKLITKANKEISLFGSHAECLRKIANGVYGKIAQ